MKKKLLFIISISFFILTNKGYSAFVDTSNEKEVKEYKKNMIQNNLNVAIAREEEKKAKLKEKEKARITFEQGKERLRKEVLEKANIDETKTKILTKKDVENHIYSVKKTWIFLFIAFLIGIAVKIYFIVRK